MEILSIMFFGVNWCGTQTSNFFLNPTLRKSFKTVLWLIFCSRATNMPVNFDYFCDFMVMVSFLACHEFELSAAEDPPSRGSHCTLNLSRLEILPLIWCER
ncbi:hypothetical protein TNCV_2948461 [Trichonephila clavipes]|nr:hypothetical protein TNCV_2948461 [Trichonephila clavipes]